MSHILRKRLILSRSEHRDAWYWILDSGKHSTGRSLSKKNTSKTCFKVVVKSKSEIQR